MSPSVAGARTSSKEDLRDDTAEDVLPCEPLLMARGAASLERRDALCGSFSTPFFAFLPSEAPKGTLNCQAVFMLVPSLFGNWNRIAMCMLEWKREMKARLW